MTNRVDLKKHIVKLPDILETGVETLAQLLIRQAQHLGQQVFYRKKRFGVWQQYTWNDVLEHVKTLAMGLFAIGVKRGQTVALVGENEPELFWSEYAAQAIGGKVVCVYPDLTPPQMEYVLIHSDALTIVCEDQEQVDKILKLEGKLPEVNAIIYWDDRGMWKYNHPKLKSFQDVEEMGREFIKKYPDSFEKAVFAGKATDIALLSYTSGSMDLPKGCIINYKNLFDMAFRLTHAIPLNPFTQYFSYNSIAWGLEQIFGIVIGLYLPFVINFPEEPETVIETLRELSINGIVLNPRQWESLASAVESKMAYAGAIRKWFYKWGMHVGKKTNLDLSKGKKAPFLWSLAYLFADKAVLSHLRHNLGLQNSYWAVSAGSGVDAELLRFFHAFGVQIKNTYGTTETGPVAIQVGETHDLETMGKWLTTHSLFGPPLEYRIVDNGELLVRGGSGFSGYYKEDLSAATNSGERWFHTGDMVKITPSNELVCIDRVDDVRRLSIGQYFAPQVIENRLRRSTFIKDAMTVLDQDKLFVAALINIDASALRPWAEHNKIRYRTFTDLSQNVSVRELIKAEIGRINGRFPEELKIKRFINLPKELDPDEDELTQTHKLRRRFLEEKYAAFVSAIRNGEMQFRAKVPIKYRDGRSSVLDTTVYINESM
jgi:long-chain acyl-CoA synthetase